MDEESIIDPSFRLFAKHKARLYPKHASSPTLDIPDVTSDGAGQIEKVRDTDSAPAENTFADLGLRESLQQTCKAMGMKRPTPVQVHCIPKILAGRDVLGLAQTGSGKTAAFALPILHRLDEERYGVFALVITPTRELAYQLSEQFKALGSALHVRCSVVVGGMDMLTQAKSLTARPHIVISTPGRIRVLLEETPDIPPVFANTKVSGGLSRTWFEYTSLLSSQNSSFFASCTTKRP